MKFIIAFLVLVAIGVVSVASATYPIAQQHVFVQQVPHVQTQLVTKQVQIRSVPVIQQQYQVVQQAAVVQHVPQVAVANVRVRTVQPVVVQSAYAAPVVVQSTPVRSRGVIRSRSFSRQVIR